MRKSKLGLIIPIVSLMMAGCTSLANEKGDSLVKWDDTLTQGMESLLKEEIPLPNIPDTVEYAYSVDSDYEYIDIIFDTQENYMEEYSSLLVSSGFALVESGTNSAYGYTTDSDGYIDTIEETATEYSYWNLEKGDLLVFLTLSSKSLIYEEDEMYYSACQEGNEIFAYLSEEEGGGGETEELDSWPATDLIAAVGCDIPHYEGTSYSFLDWSEYALGVYVNVNGVDSNCESDYKQILEDAGWVVEYDTDNEMYYAVNNNYDFELDFYYDDGTLVICIYEIQEVDTEWPYDLVEEYFADYEIPAFENIDEVISDDSEFEEYGLCIYIYTSDNDPIETYTNLLQDADFTVEYDSVEEWYVATSSDGKVQIGFYYEDELLGIQIFFAEEEEEISGNMISFSSTSQITSKSNNKVVWENGEYSFTVTKGTSSTSVGNGNYLADPLRLYYDQHCEIKWGTNEVESIVIIVDNTASKADISTFGNCKGGTADLDETTITITPNDNATSIEFDIVRHGDLKQLHVVSIEFITK